jgi:hypothetical protein
MWTRPHWTGAGKARSRWKAARGGLNRLPPPLLYFTHILRGQRSDKKQTKDCSICCFPVTLLILQVKHSHTCSWWSLLKPAPVFTQWICCTLLHVTSSSVITHASHSKVIRVTWTAIIPPHSKGCKQTDWSQAYMTSWSDLCTQMIFVWRLLFFLGDGAWARKVSSGNVWSSLKVNGVWLFRDCQSS